ELRQLHQPDGAHQDEEAAHEQQRHQQQFPEHVHSTMSLRITYLLSTTVLTKPSMAMTSAASKYTALFRYMPSSISSAMAVTLRVSSARMRSGTEGPRRRRHRASSIASPTTYMDAAMA